MDHVVIAQASSAKDRDARIDRRRSIVCQSGKVDRFYAIVPRLPSPGVPFALPVSDVKSASRLAQIGGEHGNLVPAAHESSGNCPDFHGRPPLTEMGIIILSGLYYAHERELCGDPELH